MKRMGVSLCALTLGSLLDAGEVFDWTNMPFDLNLSVNRNPPITSKNWLKTDSRKTWPMPGKKRRYMVKNVKSSRRRKSF